MTKRELHTVRNKTGTIRELARYFGVVSPDIAIQRVSKHGWSVEDAILKEKERFVKVYEAFGEKGNLESLVRKFGLVSESTVRGRLKYGWSLEDALVTPKMEANTLTYKECYSCLSKVPIALKTCYCGQKF